VSAALAVEVVVGVLAFLVAARWLWRACFHAGEDYAP